MDEISSLLKETLPLNPSTPASVPFTPKEPENTRHVTLSGIPEEEYRALLGEIETKIRLLGHKEMTISSTWYLGLKVVNLVLSHVDKSLVSRQSDLFEACKLTLQRKMK